MVVAVVIFVPLIVFIDRSLQVRVTRSVEHLAVRNASSLKEALQFVAVPLQMGKAEPEEKDSDAAQPTEKQQSLALLNVRSARVGVWELYVSNPEVVTYEWTDKKSQAVRKTTNLSLFLGRPE